MAVNIAFYVPHNLKGDSRIYLWMDFIRETARSFSADCFLIGGEANGKYAKHGIRRTRMPENFMPGAVLLDPTGEPLDRFDHAGVQTYIIGPDDRAQEQPAGIPRLSVPLPSDYPLWGAVAAGICLYDRQQKAPE